MEIIQTKDVDSKFDAYPKDVGIKIDFLRQLVFLTAEEIGIEKLEETLKWGEPSYLAPKGSTLRMDWKEKRPNHYALYFMCTSQLLESFKEVFGEIFNYEDKRAIVFGMDDKVPTKELKKCIAAALQYHEVKHLPCLGL